VEYGATAKGRVDYHEDEDDGNDFMNKLNNDLRYLIKLYFQLTCNNNESVVLTIYVCIGVQAENKQIPFCHDCDHIISIYILIMLLLGL
jgi:hypothetical protein